MVSKTKKLVFAISIFALFALIGILYLTLPIETLDRISLDFGLSHGWHIAIGIVILAVGVVLFILMLVTNALKTVGKYGRKYWYVFVLFDIVKWIAIVLMGAFIITGGVQVAQTVVG